MSDLGSYDHVIVGAGSAGCLPANRLSADSGTRVLPIKAGGRGLACPRGAVIGGSSSIDAIHMRGQAADCDGWRDGTACGGLPGWDWDAVLPWFLRHQDHIDPDGEHHRSGGEWRVAHQRDPDQADPLRRAAMGPASDPRALTIAATGAAMILEDAR